MIQDASARDKQTQRRERPATRLTTSILEILERPIRIHGFKADPQNGDRFTGVCEALDTGSEHVVYAGSDGIAERLRTASHEHRFPLDCVIYAIPAHNGHSWYRARPLTAIEQSVVNAPEILTDRTPVNRQTLPFGCVRLHANHSLNLSDETVTDILRQTNTAVACRPHPSPDFYVHPDIDCGLRTADFKPDGTWQIRPDAIRFDEIGLSVSRRECVSASNREPRCHPTFPRCHPTECVYPESPQLSLVTLRSDLIAVNWGRPTWHVYVTDNGYISHSLANSLDKFAADNERQTRVYLNGRLEQATSVTLTRTTIAGHEDSLGRPIEILRVSVPTFGPSNIARVACRSLGSVSDE